MVRSGLAGLAVLAFAACQGQGQGQGPGGQGSGSAMAAARDASDLDDAGLLDDAAVGAGELDARPRTDEPETPDPGRVIAELGAIPAWQAVVERASLLGRRRQHGVVFGRVGPAVLLAAPSSVAPGAPSPAGVPRDAGMIRAAAAARAAGGSVVRPPSGALDAGPALATGAAPGAGAPLATGAAPDAGAPLATGAAPDAGAPLATGAALDAGALFVGAARDAGAAPATGAEPNAAGALVVGAARDAGAAPATGAAPNAAAALVVGAARDAGAAPDAGAVASPYTWLIDDTEGNGALAIRIALGGKAREGDRIAAGGAWQLDAERRWFWKPDAIQPLPAAPPSDAKDPPRLPGHTIATGELPSGARTIGAARDGDAVYFQIVGPAPASDGDGWQIADQLGSPTVAVMNLPGERASYGGQDMRAADERWQLKRGQTYWVRIGKLRKRGADKPPLVNARTAPIRVL